MVYKKFAKKSYRKRPTVKKTYRRRYTKKVATIQDVKRIIHNQIENKTTSYVFGDRTIYPVSSGFFDLNSGNTIPLTPESTNLTIAQGNSQQARIGNKIKLIKAMLRFSIRPLPYDVTINPNPIPQIILCYIWSPKANWDDVADARNITKNTFFQDGSTSVGFTNTYYDTLRNVNTDMITVHKSMVFKIGNSAYEGTGQQMTYQSFTNNDFKAYALRKMNITKYMPKTIIWNDTATTASTRGVYFTYSYVTINGYVTNSNYSLICPIIDYVYEDA